MDGAEEDADGSEVSARRGWAACWEKRRLLEGIGVADRAGELDWLVGREIGRAAAAVRPVNGCRAVRQRAQELEAPRRTAAAEVRMLAIFDENLRGEYGIWLSLYRSVCQNCAAAVV